jgi:hypothetical protein
MPLPRPTRQIPQKEAPAAPKVYESADPSEYRPSDVFRFDPKEDITIDELVQLFTLFWTVDLNYDRFITIAPELQRHFDVITR